MKKIIIITNKYPNPVENNVLVFVQQLVWAMADEGVHCTVICPMPVNISPKYLKFPYKKTEVTENGSVIDIYLPKYIGFGQSDIMVFNPARITTNNFTRAVNKVVTNMPEKPDAVYGHFVTPAGITAARIGEKHNIPSFMAYGEATPKTIEHFGYERSRRELATLSGVVAVSTHSKNQLVSSQTIKEDKVEVFPNGFRKERFFPRDKQSSREKYGLPKDKFIVGFVGSFDHRKGIQRLMKAVDELDDVYLICAGKGELTPDSDKCLFSGSVNNEDLPYFYSAADVFVLPTLNEGCCNAIIEAMACGLPVVSSNLPFNDDILDETCSLKIDPLNINEIKESIKCLYYDRERLNNLHKGSLEKADVLTLSNRANNILGFINKKLK